MEEYRNRRASLKQKMAEKSCAILAASPERLRNQDVFHPYRQNSDFWYLTGFDEPEAIMILAPEYEEGEYILFCRESDPKEEVWHGGRAGLTGAIDFYQADQSYGITEFEEQLQGILKHYDRLYYTLGINYSLDQKIINVINNLKQKARKKNVYPHTIIALDQVIADLRLYKNDHEIAFMKQAAEISVMAHKNAMAMCKPGLWEYEIAAHMLYDFNKNNMDSAYPPIVGSGINACTLHYIKNNSVLEDGKLLLIDAGAEYKNYAADITRTFPINGQFNARQRDLYNLVLKAQLAAIEIVRPGLAWEEIHKMAVKVLTQGLVDLGLLQGDCDTLIAEEKYKPFYMHGTGHWLGLDVHDAGSYQQQGESILLQPGMTFTIEPGLYIYPQDDIDPAWWYMGIRIEDDILVTADGHQVLTQQAPKTIDDIQAWMKQHAI